MGCAARSERSGFGIIPVVSAEAISPAEGAPLSDGGVGCISWLDLTVPDAEATRDFYREVIGWAAQDVEMKDGDEVYADYNMGGGDGEPAAGICHARGVNTGLPSVWMLYLPVGDLAESLRCVEDGGGKIVKATRGDDGQYSGAVIQDPVGARLALAQG